MSRDDHGARYRLARDTRQAEIAAAEAALWDRHLQRRDGVTRVQPGYHWRLGAETDSWRLRPPCGRIVPAL